MSGLVIAFALYMTAMMGIGLYFSRRSSTSIDEFFLGGRRLGPFIVALSAVVSGRSAWLILGVSGMAFLYGISAVWVLPGYILVELWMFLYLAPRLRDRTGTMRDLTLPDFFESRFRDSTHTLRLVAVALICVFFTAYIGAQITAGELAFTYLLGLDWQTSLALMVAIIAVYTVVGGYLAVTFTDMVQACLMIFALLVLPIAAAFIHFGGPLPVLEHLNALSRQSARNTANLPIQAPQERQQFVPVVAGAQENLLVEAALPVLEARYPGFEVARYHRALMLQAEIELARRDLVARQAAVTPAETPLMQRTWVLLPREWPSESGTAKATQTAPGTGDIASPLSTDELRAALWVGSPATGAAVNDYYRLVQIAQGSDAVASAAAKARLSELAAFDRRVTDSLAGTALPADSKTASQFELLGLGALLAIFSGLVIGLGSPGNPHILVRYMSIADAKQLRVAAFVGTLWNVLMGWGAVYIGLVARAYFVQWWHLPMPEMLHNRELAFLALAQVTLPDFLVGLMLAGLVAAIMSTVDSQLLVAASGVSRDLYQKLTRRGRDASQWHLVWVSRLTVVVVLAVAVILSIAAKQWPGFRSVFDFVLVGWYALGAAFGPAVILALFWRRMTRQGALAGMLVGTIVVIGLKVGHAAVASLPAVVIDLHGLWGFLAATIAIVVGSLLSPDPRHTPAKKAAS